MPPNFQAGFQAAALAGQTLTDVPDVLSTLNVLDVLDALETLGSLAVLVACPLAAFVSRDKVDAVEDKLFVQVAS